MSAAVPETHKDLFQKPAFGSFTTLMPDGSPQTTPVWVDFIDGKIVVNTALGRQKDKNVRRDPRVAVTLIDPENPYRYMEVRGKVDEISTEGACDAHRQDGQEVHRPGQVSLGPPRRAAGVVEDHA